MPASTSDSESPTLPAPSSSCHTDPVSSEAKRDAQDVNWGGVAYDLSGVDWSKVDYGNGASSAPAAAPAATPASSQPEVAASPAPSSAPAEAPSPASSAAPAETSSSSSSGDVGGVIGDILNGLESFATKLGAQLGVNSETENGQIWIGGDSKHSATFTNSADKDAMVWCWGKSTMWINANKPLISIKLAPGQTQKLSVADGFSGGCGASFEDSDLFMGLLNESILEFTYGSGANGCFDISREINMKGIVLTAKGSKCTSGMDGAKQACTFICTQSGATRCGAGGGDYAIDVGSASEGACMVGKDPFTGDASGGCQMGEDGENIEVTIHGSRDW